MTVKHCHILARQKKYVLNTSTFFDSSFAALAVAANIHIYIYIPKKKGRDYEKKNHDNYNFAPYGMHIGCLQFRKR